MKKTKRLTALLLALILITSMSGCSLNEVGKYRVAAKLMEQQFCLGFRKDDKVGEAVTAALKVLCENGKAKELSVKWFGEDVVLMQGDGEALDTVLPAIEKRTLLIGYDDGRLPFSGKVKGKPSGFDVEMASEVCKLLGWKAKYIAVDVSQAEVELNSGNVDCIWGGFAYDESLTKIEMSPVYMNNTVVLAALSSSKVKGIGSLSGRTLTLSNNSYFNNALESNTSLKEKPDFVVRVPGGTEDCINALVKGSCDAIITDKASLYYYR